MTLVLFQRQGLYHVGELAERPERGLHRILRPALLSTIHMPVQGPMGGLVGMSTSMVLALLPVRAIDVERDVPLSELSDSELEPEEAAVVRDYRALLEARTRASAGLILPRAPRRVHG